MTDMLVKLISFDGGLTLLAPLVAIVLALMTRRVVPSLGIAAAVGALVVARGEPVAAAGVLLRTIWSTLWNLDHVLISTFSVLVAATVGVMGRSGGMRALMARVEGLARGRRGAMVSSWLAGALVFFDDYANCLIVGGAMGPLCDRFRVSRAKLAYIVDATAAPVASLAVISTWVGYEVGLFAGVLPAEHPREAFQVFLAALPYRFYCLFTLVFVGAMAVSGRDFGPMRQAEQEALSRVPERERSGERPTGAVLAVAPVLVLLTLTFALLYRSGLHALGDEAGDAAIFEIIGAANPYPAMLWGSLTAFVVACSLSRLTGALDLAGIRAGTLYGARAVLQALAVLYLAWTLGDLVQAAGAGAFLSTALEGRLAPWMLPGLTFTLAAMTAFATGSSFFTMGALIPLVVPLALALDPTGGPVFLASCAAVLDGAVLGDHASPISDTTILSSIGASVDVLTHVRTQLPYVLAVGAVTLVAGTIPVGLGLSVWIALPTGAALAVATVLALGRLPQPMPTPQPGAAGTLRA